MNLGEVVRQESGPDTMHIRVGTKLIKQLSTTFYPNPLIIFDELVANARDALATEVKVHVDEDKVTVEDNGEGMSPEDLVRFFYISHTKKDVERVRSFKGVKRAIIGRFGIGKISLYQVCHRFEIVTWKGGIVSSSVFNFDKFEKEEFIDTFELDVKSKKTLNASSGTRITLIDLKKEAFRKIDALKVKRRLITTMPFSDDFKIILSGTGLASSVELKSENIVADVANKYEIKNVTVENVGRIDGSITFFTKARVKDHGVFIRVFGRMVNIDNPGGVINFNSLNHAQQFQNMIHAEVNADGLNAALQTNRAGFIETHPTYESFKKWLFTEINKRCDDEYKTWMGVRDNLEKKDIPKAVSDAFHGASYALPKRASDKIAEKTAPKKPTKGEKPETQVPTKTIVSEDHPDLREIIIQGKLEMETSELGTLEAEAIFDRKRGVLIINSSNPSYLFAKSQAKLKGVVYHVFKASAVLIALESAQDKREFKSIYDSLTRDTRMLDGLKFSLKRKKEG
jgi:hypothetical protein